MALALLLAAGSGERLGAEVPKAFVKLADKSLLVHSLAALGSTPGIARIVVTLPAGHEQALPPGVLGVPGGRTRSESVRLALGAAGPGAESDAVLVHDAARPLVTPALFRAVLTALAEDERWDGAIAATRVTDTVKEAEGVEVRRTLERARLWAIQTPQAFRRGALAAALDQPAEVLAAATDDAWLIERAGGRVRVVESPEPNVKVTTQADLRLAELLLADRSESAC